MKHWTFGKRLGAGFALVVFLTIVLGAVAFQALSNATASKDAVIDENAQNLVDVQRMRSATWEKVALVRTFILTRDQQLLDEAQEVDRRFAAIAGELRSRSLNSEELSALASIEDARAEHDTVAERLFAESLEGATPEEMVLAFNRRMAPEFEKVEASMGVLVELETRILHERREASSAEARRAGFTVLAIVGLVAVISAIVGFTLTRNVTHRVGTAVQQVRSSSAELRTTAAQQASGVKEQATAMSQVSTTINELLASSRQIAESARRVAELTADVEESARAGGATVDQTREAVIGIRENVNAIVAHMLELGRRSQRIGGIVDIITELAEQTNILAINATIEAAGAGESGRRFAVVGEEIRKLADRVGGSTKEIRGLVEEIRSAVNATVMSTETGSKSVDQGVRRFDDLTLAFGKIGEIVETTAEAAREIELSTQQQTTAVEQVDVAVASVAEATRETEVGAQQTAQTAGELLSLSGELARLVQAPSS